METPQKPAGVLFGDGVLATPGQIAALVHLVGEAHHVHVTKGMFDLPEGYLSFRQDYASGNGTVYGGIGPDGSVST